MHGIPTPSQTFCAKAPAIEAKVRFDLGDQTLTRRVHADSSDLTAQDHRVHPRFGELKVVPEVEVIWPNGSTHRYRDVEAEQFIRSMPAGD